MNQREKGYVEKIAKQYKEKETTKIDELKRLDQRVNRPATIFAYILGVAGCLILGVGMCIVMKVILENLFYLGIVIGVVGIIILSINYPIYKGILTKRKNKYSQQILELSDELLNN